MLIVTALPLGGFALLGGAADIEAEPVPVPLGRQVALPSHGGGFGAELALYGSKAESQRIRLADLGCTFSGPGGADPMVTDLLVGKGLEPRSIEGAELRPLAAVVDHPPGSTVTCSGAVAAEAAPLYLVPASADATLARAGAAAAAVMFLLVGAIALLALPRAR